MLPLCCKMLQALGTYLSPHVGLPSHNNYHSLTLMYRDTSYHQNLIGFSTAHVLCHLSIKFYEKQFSSFFCIILPSNKLTGTKKNNLLGKAERPTHFFLTKIYKYLFHYSFSFKELHFRQLLASTFQQLSYKVDLFLK